jgi:hypothetical protein
MKPPRCRWNAIAVGLTSSLLLAACAASRSLGAAKRGDLRELKASIVRERARCRLDRADVRDLAQATADRELLRAPPAETSARIDEARACARWVSDALEKIAGRADDAGASATLALLDARTGSGGSARFAQRYRSSPQPLWRAVAARASLGQDFGSARRIFYTDSDERVRLAALRAALEEADRADAGSLLEVARLDPNPLARALSARALGSIANSDIVLALRDLYVRADEGLRQSIVDAWGQKEAARAGGIRELVLAVETETGAPAIEAGWVLMRFTSEPDAPSIGIRALLRGIADGSSPNRTLAILHAPLSDPRIIDALRKAADSPDVGVATAALSRLVEQRSTRDEALRRLEILSKAGAKGALHTMARMGNRSAIREVTRELSADSSEARLSAARTLIAANEHVLTADLLADPDPHVRIGTACAILNSHEE